MLMVALSFLPPGLMMEVRVQFLSFLLILFHLSSLPLPLHLLHHSPSFSSPSGQANLITTSKTITVPGQIGMRPPLHCTNEFSTCIWFTNDTKIPGQPQFHQITRFQNPPDSWFSTFAWAKHFIWQHFRYIMSIIYVVHVMYSFHPLHNIISNFLFKVLQLLTLSFGLTASSFTTKQGCQNFTRSTAVRRRREATSTGRFTFASSHQSP